MNKSIILFISLFIPGILQAEVFKSVNVYLAGSLSNKLTTEEKNTITSLKISGTIDARDFKTMRDAMPLLADIDLFSANISSYSGFDGTSGSTFYPSNTLPESSFYSPYTWTGKMTLNSVKLPFYIITIEKNAFLGCTGLKSVSMSPYTTSIGESAFENCQNLTSLDITSALTAVSKKTFKSCIGLTTFNIPSSVASIGESAFENCGNLTSVVFPSALLSIDKMAFKSCKSLTSFNLPSSVTSIGESAFEDCTGLTSVDLPSSLAAIQIRTFKSCKNLTSVSIPNSISNIDEESFYHCDSLAEINIPNSVVRIGKDAFYHCISLTTINIPSSVRELGAGVFSDCENLSAVYLPNSISKLDYYTFNNCISLTSINIPSSVIIIDYWAFQGCSGLKNVTIPTSVIELGESSFEDCTGLNSIIIPSSVKKIGSKAFSYCMNLNAIYSHSIEPVNLLSSEFVFFFVDKSKVKIHVPFGSKSKYELADQWKDFTNIVEMPGLFLSDHSIGMNPSGGNASILISSSENWSTTTNQSWLSINPTSGGPGTTSMTITANPNTGLSNRTSVITFSSPNLTESSTISVTQYSKIVVTPGNLKTVLSDQLSTIKNLILVGTIDARDFKTMRNEMPSLLVADLSEVSIVSYSGNDGTSPYVVDYAANTIPDYAFGASYYNVANTNLSYIILPSTATEIGIHAFNSCTGLIKVNIPSSITKIGISNYGQIAFAKCSAFIEVDELNPNYSSADGVLFNKSRTSLMHCPVSKAGKYVIPSSVVKLEYGAFFECNLLTSVILPPSLVNIDANNFLSCKRIRNINIPSSVTKIGGFCFNHCSELESVTTYLTEPLYFDNSESRFDVESTTILYVPFGTKALYQSANQWNWFKIINEMSGLNISADTIKTVPTEGSKVLIDLASNVAWSVLSDQSWLTVYPQNGTGNSKLTFTASANPNKSVRLAIVTISSPGFASKSVVIIQDAKLYDFQVISLTSGWNIFSAYNMPVNNELKAVVNPLITDGSLTKVQDETGNALENFGIFGGWVNNIGNLNATEGYKIKVTKDCQLTITGTPVVLPYKIPLKSGWNIIGYPKMTEADGKAVWQRLIDNGNLIKVQDESGKAIENWGVFGGWKNGIGNLIPGEGYKVKVNASDTLIIQN